MAIEAVYLVPHPPILVPEVGGKNSEELEKTHNGLRKVIADIEEKDFDYFLTTSPHLPLSDEFVFYTGELSGDLSAFGASVSIQVDSSRTICEILNGEILAQGLPSRCEMANSPIDILDHGTVVPLWLLFGSNKVRCTVFSLAWGGGTSYFDFGKALADAAEKIDKKSALIVSGDLSHRLTKGAPAGYSPGGQEFDDHIYEIISSGEIRKSLIIDRELVKEAGHCGLPGIQSIAGIVDGKAIKTNVDSYEGPFGVGYMVARIEVENGK